MPELEPLLRINKWLKLLLGGIVTAIVLYFIYPDSSATTVSGSRIMIILAFPGAVALVGLLEIVSGVPYHQIAHRWDELAGWQRGVLGMLVVAIVLSIPFILVWLLA